MDQLKASIRQALEHLLPAINARLQEPSFQRPLVLGLTGLQGSGKSTWASHLVEQLTQEHHLHAITVSLDDFYLPHEPLSALASGPNTLHRTRGQPGTHDTELAQAFFQFLKDPSKSRVQIPEFDKSRYNGTGDRGPPSTWKTVSKPIDIVIFEGWCVGFQPVPAPSEQCIRAKRDLAIRAVEAGQEDADEPTHTLGRHDVGNLVDVNERLAEYCASFMGPQHFDLFVQLDTERLRNVYVWRREQEHKLIKRKGSGMSDDQVKEFIMGYMPAYELYLDGLRSGLFKGTRGESKRHLRVLLGRQREVLGMEWCDESNSRSN